MSVLKLMRPFALLTILLAVGCGTRPSATATAEPSQPATSYPAPTAMSATQPTTNAALAQAVGAPAANFCRPGAPLTKFSVVGTYPHDSASYTEGLVAFDGATLYEGTGDYANSLLREVTLANGQVVRQIRLSEAAPDHPQAFGEGIAVVGDQIFQLTWQDGFGLIYDRASFAVQKRFTYPPAGSQTPVEGWGLTYDGQHLIMSDGSGTLYLVDPAQTFRTGVLAITGQIAVHDSQGPLDELNELEYVHGEIYANIWNCDLVARIDPATGTVRSYLDLSSLRPLLATTGSHKPEVLNGIAYDAANDRLFVTGKWWPSLFEIDLLVSQVYLPLTMAVSPPAPAASNWS